MALSGVKGSVFVLLQIPKYKTYQLFARGWHERGKAPAKQVQPDVVFQNLVYQRVHSAADRRRQHEDVGRVMLIAEDLSGSVWICLDLLYLNLDPLEIITQFGSLHACMPSDLWRKSLNLLYLPRGVL